MKTTNNQLEVIIELIQDSLIGNLDPSSNFNPQFLAKAIIDKLEFGQTYKEKNSKKVEDAIQSFNQMINDIDLDMDEELQKLNDNETLLKNFIRGQKTTCEKLRESLKTI